MSLWACRQCGCTYAVGLSMCPQCTSTDYEEAGMPKITVHGGPSNAGEDAPIEEVATSATVGTSSSTSTTTPETPSSEGTTSKPRSVPTTGNRSGKGRRAGSTARSTGTGQGPAKGGN